MVRGCQGCFLPWSSREQAGLSCRLSISWNRRWPHWSPGCEVSWVNFRTAKLTLSWWNLGRRSFWAVVLQRSSAKAAHASSCCLKTLPTYVFEYFNLSFQSVYESLGNLEPRTAASMRVLLKRPSRCVVVPMASVRPLAADLNRTFIPRLLKSGTIFYIWPYLTLYT